jgi:hypothetical protein
VIVNQLFELVLPRTVHTDSMYREYQMFGRRTRSGFTSRPT